MRLPQPRDIIKTLLLPVLVLAITGLVLLLSFRAMQTVPEDCAVKLIRANQCVVLEQADTPEARQQGLSGRQSLPQDQGMLFDFGIPREACMWMKDMKFALDMIWLNEQKQVRHIERNVQPESYPHSYCPNEPAKYVIEVNAGQVDKLGLQIGAQASF